MCRLFGMSCGPYRSRATFWLLEASDSLAAQSYRYPDGSGLGVYDAEGHPSVHKRPIAAHKDREFAREARQVESSIFIAHLRYASVGGVELRNTHPFQQNGRLFAHNGVIEDLSRLEEQLGEYSSLPEGDTDSERFFTLITKEIDAHGGDVTAGLVAASRWIVESLPVYSINLVLTTAQELWALRYPATHGLFVLERQPGGQHGCRCFDGAGASGSVRVRCACLARHAAVIVASEPMDENPHWTELSSGELLHVGPDLSVSSEVVLDSRPANLLSLADLDPHAAASQQPAPQS